MILTFNRIINYELGVKLKFWWNYTKQWDAVHFFKNKPHFMAEYWNGTCEIVLAIFVSVCEIISCHEHVSVDWSKISRPHYSRIYCHKCHHHSSRTKGVPERYICWNVHRHTIASIFGRCLYRMWWTSASRLTNLWWLAFDECATNYSYSERSAGILNLPASTLRKSISLS